MNAIDLASARRATAGALGTGSKVRVDVASAYLRALRGELASLERELAAVEIGTPRGRVVAARVTRRCAACGERVAIGSLARHVRRATLVCSPCGGVGPDDVLEAR